MVLLESFQEQSWGLFWSQMGEMSLLDYDGYCFISEDILRGYWQSIDRKNMTTTATIYKTDNWDAWANNNENVHAVTHDGCWSSYFM